ncbi:MULTISPECIES: hypothetical protein [Trichocoleus]|uniref:Uncharacterized protein n=1 Tax=Trichocoleus desertorum GB2-A4 TaxID=2933944 RepID=A0ABV0J2J5_9CYAN|nr:hypothetical protein [Trichocoleus sp. FACHB-46]MBD1860622.1 hypothetical protein [Trichocoleus sp. FACHB-46]
MDPIQEQVIALNTKVDGLQKQMIEHFNHRLSEAVAEMKLLVMQGAPSTQPEAHGRRYLYSTHSSREMGMDHKDVLTDTSYPSMEDQSSERDLAPEIQIRRLTVQLTAAYNRIAALEEQLLSQRVH